MNLTSLAGRASLMALAIAAAVAHADDTAAPTPQAAPETTAATPAAATAAAPAAAAPGPRVYVGIGTGRTTFGYDSEQCTRDTGLSCNLESTDTGTKLYVGATLTPNVAIEGSYYDLGSLEGTAAGGLVSLKEDQTALSVALLGLAPFNDNVGGLLRIGYYSSSVDATGSGPGGSVSMSDSSSGFELGAGLNVNFNRNVGVRLEYERLFEAGDSATDVSLASASLRLTF